MNAARFCRNRFLSMFCLWLLAAMPAALQAQVRVPGFRPSTSGLHFVNGFPSVPLLTINVLGIPVPIGDAANGLCGGMVFTVMDYRFAGLPIPCDQSPPTSGPLFNYLVARLFDSFNLPFGPMHYMALMDPNLPDHETTLSQLGLAPHGRAWVMIREEWPKIKADLDLGMLSPIALIRVKSLDPFQMGHNHQVLAYGYDLVGNDLQIFVYDPNHPDNDSVTIALNIGVPEHTTTVTYNGGIDSSENVFCFFRTDYNFVRPPSLPDQTPPSIQGPLSMTVSAGSQCSRPVFFGVTATDDCGSATVQCQPASGSTFSAGTTVVTCTARDNAGNTSTHSFNVTVNGATPAASPGGSGLLGTYYDNIDFTVAKAARIEAVDFDWGLNAPLPGVDAETFSVRWSGQVVPRYTDSYTFYTWSDDGVRLWINGQLVINNWTDHAPSENQGTIYLVAGQPYDIVMDYYENGGYAMAKLSWSSGCQAKEIIPASQLLPGAPDCPTGPEPTFFSDFNNGTPSGMTLFGSATAAGGYLKLTLAQDGQYGIAYIDDFGGGRYVQGFRATFKAALFGSTCCGNGAWPADGFSFNLVPASSALTNPGYGEPAEEGLDTGLVVNFDTWDNGAGEAPAIEVKWLGQVIARAPFQASQSPAGITDPAAAAKQVAIDLERGGAISVSYGGTVVINRAQTPYSAGTVGTPKWIFGARTGAANDNHWIDDLRIVTYTTPNSGTLPIPGLFNTGVDAQGRPLPDNAGDPHYRLVAGSVLTGTPVAATAGGGFPIGPWLPDDRHSAWISPTADTFGPGNSDYYYQIEFNLAGLDPVTAVIQGQWAADNFGMDILLNSISTGQSHIAPGGGQTPFTIWQPFVISHGFRPGNNTLTFIVRNDAAEPNPTGLRVELCGRALALPPTLQIERRGNGLAVTWRGAGYLVQTAPSASGPWTDWSSGTSLNGGDYECALPMAAGAHFYRLREVSIILAEPGQVIDFIRNSRAGDLGPGGL